MSDLFIDSFLLFCTKNTAPNPKNVCVNLNYENFKTIFLILVWKNLSEQGEAKLRGLKVLSFMICLFFQLQLFPPPFHFHFPFPFCELGLTASVLAGEKVNCLTIPWSRFDLSEELTDRLPLHCLAGCNARQHIQFYKRCFHRRKARPSQGGSMGN